MTASVLARPPMLPGLMRSLAAPRRAALDGYVCVEVDVGHHRQGRGFADLAAKASRQSRRGMAMRTISHPAAASRLYLREVRRHVLRRHVEHRLHRDRGAAAHRNGTHHHAGGFSAWSGLAADCTMALPSADRSVVAFEGILPCCRAMRRVITMAGLSAGAPERVEVRPDREARRHTCVGYCAGPLAAGPPRPGTGRPPRTRCVSRRSTVVAGRRALQGNARLAYQFPNT